MSSVADFEVVEPLPGTDRWLCRAPGRLGEEDLVAVELVAVTAADRQQAAETAARVAASSVAESLRLIEFGPDGSGAYLVTEPYQAGTLDSSPPADLKEQVGAVVRAARAAHALHEAGLAHGGIAAGSVLLTERGPVLGPPHLVRSHGLATRAGSWRALVTVDPEVLGGDPPSRAADLWSLGSLLHLLVSPRPLYPGIEGDQPVTAVQRMMFTRPDPDPALPDAVREAIGACLARDQADRPATAEELAERLEAQL